MATANGVRYSFHMIDWDEPWVAYKLRWRRRQLLVRALRKRRQLRCLVNRTRTVPKGAVLAFATMRNEAVRLPYWLDHHRRMGVQHFHIVDNGSDDGTPEMLQAQPDVSLWSTGESYKASRFGMDWINWLLSRYGHGHWCLTLDADELFVMPHHGKRDLNALTHWLDRTGQNNFPALMLDLYPKGRLADSPYSAGQDPTEVLPYFDRHNYTFTRHPKLHDLSIKGGPRARTFFTAEPRRAPTLSKVPLIKWNRRWTYVSSTHTVLPRRLNRWYGEGELPSGVLLHTKFLNTIVDKSAEEKQRKEHFENSDLYGPYYDGLIANPTLWTPKSTRYISWRQLEAMGLMSRGGWV